MFGVLGVSLVMGGGWVRVCLGVHKVVLGVQGGADNVSGMVKVLLEGGVRVFGRDAGVLVQCFGY